MPKKTGQIKKSISDGNLCVSFGWFDFEEEAISDYISEKRVSKMLFYQCGFRKTSVADIQCLGVHHFSFLHCKFDVESAESVANTKSIKSIKSHDSVFGDGNIDDLLKKRLDISLI